MDRIIDRSDITVAIHHGSNTQKQSTDDRLLPDLIHSSRDVRKPDFCICENKDADQLRSNREADQRLCFHYTDSTILLLPKYEISSLYPSYAVVQPGLCRTWSKTPKTGFLTSRLILFQTQGRVIQVLLEFATLSVEHAYQR